MRPILLPQLTTSTANEIQEWIVANMPPYAEGAVLGMSGGIDSSLVAALTSSVFRRYRTALPWQTDVAHDGWDLTLRGYGLPTKLNTPEDVVDAQRIAKLYDIPFDVVDLQAAVAGMEAVFSNERVPGNPTYRLSIYDRGNMISRVRANVLWTLAAHHKSIVMGTGNKDEDYSIGYYTLLGDGAVHMNPIGFLSKRLVRELATEIGLPEDLVKRTPAAGLEPGQTDEKDLGYPYEFVELVVQGIDQGFSLWDLALHPQILAFDSLLKKLEKWHVGVEAILDVLHRHDLAKRKAEYIRPKVPDIKLPLKLPDQGGPK